MKSNEINRNLLKTVYNNFFPRIKSKKPNFLDKTRIKIRQFISNNTKFFIKQSNPMRSFPSRIVKLNRYKYKRT
jgi:hypothetical protein